MQIISMNPTKLLASLLSVIVFGSAISMVNATITKEYFSDSYDVFDNKRFSFKVTLTIETEPNGKWLTEQYYSITFAIILTYVNQSMFPLGLTVDFYSPTGIFLVDRQTVPWNSTSASLSTSGSLRVQVYNTLEKRCEVRPSISYKTYSEKFTSGYWSSNEPIYIDIKSPTTSPSPLPPELIFVAVGIILGIVVTGSYFIIKTRKRRSEQHAG